MLTIHSTLTLPAMMRSLIKAHIPYQRVDSGAEKAIYFITRDGKNVTLMSNSTVNPYPVTKCIIDNPNKTHLVRSYIDNAPNVEQIASVKYNSDGDILERTTTTIERDAKTGKLWMVGRETA